MTKKPPEPQHSGDRAICRNKRARFQYDIVDTVEAGIVLVGTEVKSLRDGKASIEDGFARIRSGEVFLYDCDIPPYEHGNRMNHEPKRVRKLLLHKRQISELAGKSSGRGLTLIPLRLYFSRGLAKVLLGLGKGKKLYDKRQDVKKRDAQREIGRAMGRRR